MFFSLIQTLVCVLLVNGGLYALHLTGNANGNSNGNGPLSLQQQKNAHVSSGSSSGSHSKSPLQMPAQRLSEELADLAQLERERLMVMGLAKQTAEESGYHGRPIITGRIKMHPVEDIDSDYSAWLQQQARNVMFGNVVKHPHTELNDEQDYDTGGGGGGGVSSSSLYGPHLRPSQYEYGRVVQPADKEFENPHNLDLDDFMELESVADEEELFPDLDGYAYLDELIADGNKERMQQHMPQFPGFRHAQQQQQSQSHHSYVNRHEPQTLQELFEKEQEAAKQTHNKQQQQQQQQQLQQQQQQQHNMEQVNQFNQKYRNNIRLQQKWQRKRNQLNQQQSLPRNIFGQKTKQPQLHHFKIQSTNKLSLANSEATATSKVNKAHNGAQALLASPNKAEAKNSDTSGAAAAASSSSSSSSSASSSSSNSNASSPQKDSAKKTAQLQIEENQILHPNRKRSGMAAAGSMQTPNLQSPHSLASQLMLRTARGQRQYDVPQIECPTAMDGMERFACPTPDVQGRYRCIDDHVLCDGFIDCPEGEDEDRRSCMFYKTTKAHLDVLADALLRWARGR